MMRPTIIGCLTVIIVPLCCLLFDECTAAGQPHLRTNQQQQQQQQQQQHQPQQDQHPPHRHRKLVQATNPSFKIQDQYIIVFDNDKVDDINVKIQKLLSGIPDFAAVGFQYNQGEIKGISVQQLPESFLSHILDDPDVLYVEEDQIVQAYNVVEQKSPTWGLDRLDQETLPLDHDYKYLYTGAGVTAFILDTGIRSTHREFAGRVTCGFSVFQSNSCEDAVGHGTHVAGTIGGSTYGVAKEVDLVTIRVLDSEGVGETSGVLAAIDYIRTQKRNNPNTPMVANLSLGGFYSRSLNAAVENAVAAGVVFVVAAGNSDDNACNESPASSDSVITVAAISTSDARSDFSNYGPCVSIYAPGEDITSAWASGDDATKTFSGTSMASPHVAGVAALYLQAHPTWSPLQVWEAMRADGIQNAIYQPGWNTPNLLVSTHSLIQIMIPENAPPAATAAPTTPNTTTIMIDGLGNGTNTDNINNIVLDIDICLRVFDSCRSSSECCLGGCSAFKLCWFW